MTTATHVYDKQRDQKPINGAKDAAKPAVESKSNMAMLDALKYMPGDDGDNGERSQDLAQIMAERMADRFGRSSDTARSKAGFAAIERSATERHDPEKHVQGPGERLGVDFSGVRLFESDALEQIGNAYTRGN
jgi:hypothetical protein